MTSNRLSVHIVNGDIFYENHNAGNNIYTFLMDQQNENAAFILKKFAYRNTFEKYINSFLAALMTLKNMTYSQIKIQNICFIVLPITLKHMEANEGK